MFRKCLSAVLLLASSVFLHAQDEQKDSLVMLLSAKSARAVDIEGESYRKVIGPARFLHNNTYLLCDTAFWNVDSRVIRAIGNVSIMQEETVLTSDRLTYLIDEDLAQFRGSLVQLQDKDHNTLRTHNLDYNTKDSLAIFFGGASMRDKDGQIIESENGSYSSPKKLFTFENDVNMFTDSIFVKTTKLEYESEKDLASFGYGTNAWKDENMLSSDSGWYDRSVETFLFNDNVHVLSLEQEGWCDSLFFYRNTSDVSMLGKAQVSDTTRNVYALADEINYSDSQSRVSLSRTPAVVTMVKENQLQADSTYKEVTDTVYFGADNLTYYTRPMYDVDSLFKAQAKERKKVLELDPVTQFRKMAAEEAAKAAEEAALNDPNFVARRQAEEAAKRSREENAPVVREPESPEEPMPSDSLMVSDSTATLADSVAVKVEEPLDTTRVGFLEAVGNVKIYRKSMQAVCDSLLYSDLDSLARLFKEPVIYQEEVRQYSADSISIVVKNESMEKASLMSNAFIALQEDSLHHNQIKSTEMLAYFDKDGGLSRFDALGGALALFYIEENDTLATVNKKDSKMMSAMFKDGEIQRIYYFDQAKSDAYPVAQLSKEERMLKGFAWRPEKRPADRYAVTSLTLRPGERSRYESRPRAQFLNTERYFPGYIGDVYRQIEVRDSLKAVRERERMLEKEAAEKKARLDSLSRLDSLALADSLRVADSLAVAADSLALADSLSKVAVAVDTSVVSDSVLRAMSPKERKAYKKEQARKEKELKKKRRQELREAKWKKKDEAEARKAEQKRHKRLEKERKLKRKALKEIAEQERKDREVYERYRKKYEELLKKETEKSAARKNDSVGKPENTSPVPESDSKAQKE